MSEGRGWRRTLTERALVASMALPVTVVGCGDHPGSPAIIIPAKPDVTWLRQMFEREYAEFGNQSFDTWLEKGHQSFDAWLEAVPPKDRKWGAYKASPLLEKAQAAIEAGDTPAATDALLRLSRRMGSVLGSLNSNTVLERDDVAAATLVSELKRATERTIGESVSREMGANR